MFLDIGVPLLIGLGLFFVGVTMISLNLKKQLYLDDVPVSKAELVSAMTEIGVSDPNTTIYVRADRKLPYGEVVEIMKILHDASITKMALVTEADR